ncbi:MAG: TatD family hydrolase [Thermoguttaceae bacterium]|nr:TatD family hydrolase [Thermoguttaceae bacterium]
MRWIDTHAHLDSEEFVQQLPELFARSAAAGVVGVIAPAVSAASTRRLIKMTESFSTITMDFTASGRHSVDSLGSHPAVPRFPFLRFAAGIQPTSTPEIQPGDWETIQAASRHPLCVAIGEIGLDRYWAEVPFDTQLTWFIRQLEWAQECDLPVLIHCREAESDLLPVLRQASRNAPLRGLIHSFSGDLSFAYSCLELGLYLSFSGMVTYTNRKFSPLWEVAATIPVDRLLVETDAPYLTPTPLRGKVAYNEPAWIEHTLRRIATLRGMAAEQLARQTIENTDRLFKPR